MDDIFDEEYFYESIDDMSPLAYAEHLGLANVFADVCVTKAEMDAVVLCLFEIDTGRHLYEHASTLRPKDYKGETKVLNNRLARVQNQVQRDDIIMEWEATRHWHSRVKTEKDHIFDACKTILKDASIGRHRREALLKELNQYLLNK